MLPPWEKLLITLAFLVFGYFAKALGRINNKQPIFLNDLAIGSAVMLLTLSKVTTDLCEGFQRMTALLTLPSSQSQASALNQLQNIRFAWFIAVLSLFFLSLVNDRDRLLRPKTVDLQNATDQRGIVDVVVQNAAAFCVLLTYLCVAT